MKRSLFLLAAAFTTSLTMTHASVLLDFNDGTGTPNAVTINSGDAFSFNIFLTSTSEQTVGLSYFFLESTVANPLNPGSGMFTITGRTITGTPFTELQTSNTTFLSASNAVLDPQNNSDAGAIEPDLTAQPAGTYFIANFTIQSSVSVAPGTYQINFVNAPNTVYLDQDLNAQSFDSLGTYTVTVVPEPSAAVMLGAGCAIFAIIRRRSASARQPGR